ncbi:glycogenin [Klebsormidium nitens]|uniref:Glycogenin n=1 Tax=Klebsormidium nitens TaxID=105231 RepID=A0A1Y1IBU6_KLENI|nr:glycogenin [Klebsormidium nitens]|eukprot:GAQ88435.1 glycogenin [Klebsormidium nitens]
MQRPVRQLFTLAVICVIAPLIHARPEPNDVSKAGMTLRIPEHRTKEAYVTLLYAEEFLLGVRVLGQSLRESGTKNDLVALISKGVTDKGAELLQADGWIVKRVELLSNPNSKHPTRFWGVYTKLTIFNLVEYERVTYLDADTIVLKSIDDVFGCKGFCAVLRHSERLNSGFMVVEPSKELFADMMDKIATTPSYTGGDQGFLNEYYGNFINAPLYDPEFRPVTDDETAHRLPTRFNGDVGLYVLNSNKWMVDDSLLRVIHFTLGPLKPWDWWTAYILNPVDRWEAYRQRLPASIPGVGAGWTHHVSRTVTLLAVLPFLVSILLGRKWLMQVYRDLSGLVARGQLCGGVRARFRQAAGGLPLYGAVNGGAGISMTSQPTPGHFVGGHPPYLESLSVAVCFSAVLLALGTATFLVPRQVPPRTGLLLVYEWLFFVFGVAFAKYLEAVHFWGRSTAAGKGANGAGGRWADESSRGRNKPEPLQAGWDSETAGYVLGMGGLAILAPCLPWLLGVDALFAKLGLMLAGLFLWAIFMTHAASRLAVRYYLSGILSSAH